MQNTRGVSEEREQFFRGRGGGETVGRARGRVGERGMGAIGRKDSGQKEKNVTRHFPPPSPPPPSLGAGEFARSRRWFWQKKQVTRVC